MNIAIPKYIACGTNHTLFLADEEGKDVIMAAGRATDGVSGLSKDCTGSFTSPVALSSKKFGLDNPKTHVKRLMASEVASFAIVVEE